MQEPLARAALGVPASLTCLRACSLDVPAPLRCLLPWRACSPGVPALLACLPSWCACSPGVPARLGAKLEVTRGGVSPRRPRGRLARLHQGSRHAKGAGTPREQALATNRPPASCATAMAMAVSSAPRHRLALRLLDHSLGVSTWFSLSTVAFKFQAHHLFDTFKFDAAYF